MGPMIRSSGGPTPGASRPRGVRHAVAGALVLAALAASSLGVQAQSPSADAVVVGDGMTTPVHLPAYDPSAPAGSKPPGLPRTLAFTEDNSREFQQAMVVGLKAAAKDCDLEFEMADANSDSATNIGQLNQYLAKGVGGIISSPVDPAAQAPVLQDFMRTGAYVGNIVVPPATTLLNAPQYATGKPLGDAAAAYITDHLGGKANVVILNQDSAEFVRPRFQAIRDALSALPGVTIVADVEPTPTNKDGGFETMSTVLQAHPDVDVVLGADSVVLGALAALQAAGKDRPDQFLGGVDGEAEALDAMLTADSPYKASISLAPSVFAYAMGCHASDWLDGKSVPQAINTCP